MSFITLLMESQLVQGIVATLLFVAGVLGYGYKQRRKGEKEAEEEMESRNYRETMKAIETRESIVRELDESIKEVESDNPDSTPYSDRLHDKWSR